MAGKTYSALKALPAGSVYFIHTQGFAAYCRFLLHEMGRDSNEIQFVSVVDTIAVRGKKYTAAAVDHAVYEHKYARERWLAANVNLEALHVKH